MLLGGHCSVCGVELDDDVDGVCDACVVDDVPPTGSGAWGVPSCSRCGWPWLLHGKDCETP